jgi:cysteine-rich repeat protein
VKNPIKIFLILVFLFLFYPFHTFAASSQSNPSLNVGEFCGDHIINGTEQCDDGNYTDGDGCNSTCVIEFCGDSLVNNNTEVCDSNTRACTTLNNATCDGWNACVATESCGDGLVNGNEACDDGNNINCDNCREDCTRMDNICGDGYVECGEECDGLNGVSGGYRCSAQCLQIKADGSSMLPEMLTPITIFEIFLRISTDEAVIIWATNKKAFCSLEWGDTPDIKNEKIQEMAKNTSHRAHLEKLQSDTEYFYKIECHDTWGHRQTTELRNFYTYAKDDHAPPSNVENFRAIALNKNINLYWNNPKDRDLVAVKILRREDRYPESINDGISIYNDRKENFVDKNVAAGKKYYYTAFAYDNNSNYSSGAIASAFLQLPKDNNAAKKNKDQPIFKDNDTSLIMPYLPKISSSTAQNELKLNIQDLLISAASETINFKFMQNKIVSLPGTIMQFKLPADKIPKFLKTIILSIIPENIDYGSNNYLFKIDKDDKFYVADIGLPLKVGDYQLLFTILDYQNQRIYKTKADLEIQKFGLINFLDTANNKYLPISNSLASLSVMEDEKLVKWPANKYMQYNPIMSNSLGQYGFIVPNGRYVIKAEKKGFYPYTSPLYKISNNIMNQNIEMVSKPFFNWLLFVLEIIIGLLIYISVRILAISVKKYFFK